MSLIIVISRTRILTFETNPERILLSLHSRYVRTEYNVDSHLETTNLIPGIWIPCLGCFKQKAGATCYLWAIVSKLCLAATFACCRSMPSHIANK
jgi:hypothetical protein